MDGLLAAIAGEEPRGKAGCGLVVGHIHPHVGDLERGLAFYRDVLGFELMTLMPGADKVINSLVVSRYQVAAPYNEILWRECLCRAAGE